MNAGAIFNTGLFASLFINAAHRFVRQRLLFFMFIRRWEQVGLGSKSFIIMAQFRQQSFGKQCIAIFAAFAMTIPYVLVAQYLGPEFPSLFGGLIGLAIVVIGLLWPWLSARMVLYRVKLAAVL